MEKEKQIENIENIVDVILPIMKDGEFSARNLARALNKSGYGNVKEALKETARECLKILNDIGGCDATEDYYKGWDKAIDGAYKDISDKYGVTAFDEEDEE